MKSFTEEIATTPGGRNIFVCINSCPINAISLNCFTGPALFINRGDEVP